MKKTLVALSLAAMAVPALAQKAPEPDYTISGNFAVTSDYRFRGVSQSNKDAAVQGGIDFEHKSGFYAGNWNSSVSEWTSPYGSGIESDIYGGFKTELMGVGLDVGLIYYYYPGAQKEDDDFFNPFNTREFYIGLSYGPVSFKASRTLSERYFGLGKNGDDTLTTNAKGTMYYDLSFSKEILANTTLDAKAGFLRLADKVSGAPTIKDYSIGVTYDLSGWGLGFSYYKTSGMNAAAKDWFTSTDGKNTKLYDSGVALTLSKSF